MDTYIRALARQCEGWVMIAQEAQHATPRPEVPTMTTYGPRTPGGDITLALADMAGELRGVLLPMRETIAHNRLLPDKLPALLRFTAFHSGLIAECDRARDVCDVLRHWDRWLRDRFDDDRTRELAEKPEPYLSWRSIIVRAQAYGHVVTRVQLRNWATRGHITTQTNREGLACYRFSEVLGRLTR